MINVIGCLSHFCFKSHYFEEATDRSSGSTIKLQHTRLYAAASEMSSSSTGLKSVDYEIFGDVQGVFFRKYTEEQARKLGLVGWVKNTAAGTVTGQVQGAVDKVNFMMNWLKSVGSPMSRIDKAHFSNERDVSKLDFNKFSTRY
ncbi:acylphosphatase-2-like isoform X2 [Pristis pectinata]|uniref:acylphosphatase-2-like isoform X2 n=1 Tax=Pristis pectinata TaxID=685728 RepID=UPI00223E4A4B|nr:acylphosphatase-2-like isoform X2 [Pristis pectinata]